MSKAKEFEVCDKDGIPFVVKADAVGVPRKLFLWRVRNGWTYEDAILPKMTKRERNRMKLERMLQKGEK